MECGQVKGDVGYTNNVLIQDSKQGPIYFLPGYMRLNFKNFNCIDLENMDAQINATILFSVYFGDLNMELVNLISKRIVFMFNKNGAFKLEDDDLETKYKINKKDKYFTYSIRRMYDTRIQSDVFLTPFEMIELILTTTVQSIEITEPQKCIVKFNLMQCQNIDTLVSYSSEQKYGIYDLAEAMIVAEYSKNNLPSKYVIMENNKTRNRKLTIKKNQINSNDIHQTTQSGIKIIKTPLEQISKLNDQNMDVLSKVVKKNQKKMKGPKHFQYAHFTIPMYKHPMATLVTIFIPLWLLAIINLTIFFQSNDLASRVSSIAALMVAFVALIPTIRSQIPPSPTITLVQILVFAETFTCCLCIAQSVYINQLEEFQIDWHKDPFFLVAFIISIGTFLIIACLIIVHFCIWQVRYNNRQYEERSPFNPKEWFNLQCDREFYQFPNVKLFNAKEWKEIQNKSK